MRYVLILLALAVGALALWQWNRPGVSDGEDVVPSPNGGESREAPLDDSPQPADPVIQETTPTVAKDELVDTTHRIICSLISGEANEDGREDFIADLQIALEGERIGDITTRDEAAKMTVDTILKQVRQFRPRGATVRIQMDDMKTRMARDIAEGLAADMRDRLSLGMNVGGLQHDGSLVTASIDVELPEGYVKAPWMVMGGFEYKEGMELPPKVQILDGKKVGVAGYMMSLGEFTDVHNFLLVEAQWSCCFGIPPDVHQVVVVRIPDSEPGVELTTMPVLCLGTLSVGEEKEGRWVTSVYRLSAEEVQEIE